jgi:hypothetical protein
LRKIIFHFLFIPDWLRACRQQKLRMTFNLFQKLLKIMLADHR